MASPTTDNAIQIIHSHIHRLARHVAELNERHLHHQDELRLAYEQKCAELMTAMQRKHIAAAQRHHQKRDAAYTRLAASVHAIRQKWIEGSHTVPWVVLPWDEPVWQEYVPQADLPVPSLVRLGAFQVDANIDVASAASVAGDETALALGDLPAFVPFLGAGHLFVQGEAQGGSAQDAALFARAVWQNLMLRLIVTVPPHRLRLILFDPANLGATLAPFLPLPPAMRGYKVFAAPQEIGQQFEKLIDHIEYVIQSRLLNAYATIEEYNAQTNAIAVPYHVVVLTDFPAGFDERLFERLLHIARNGPRAGVYLLAHLNTQNSLPGKVNLADLTQLGQILTVNEHRSFSWPLADGRELLVLLDKLPDANLTNRWLTEIGRTLEQTDISLDYARIAIPTSDCWQRQSIDSLSVPIGIQSSGELHTLQLGQAMVHHGLIGGVIGSGKSNLLHVIITQLALTYSPEELELYLVDFKEGVEFQNYVDLPHARAVGLESEREFGLSILHRLRDIVAERGQIFKEAGGLVNDIITFRRRMGQTLPRVLLVMDEFQVLFGEDDGIARESARIIEDIARRGRAFGIHLLLSSQSPSMAGIYGSRIYNQIGLRIALRCRAQDAQAILGEGNEAASQLSQVGEAIFNADMGVPESNRLIRAALLTPEVRLRYLATIQELAAGQNYPKPIAFSGRAPAYLADNMLFQEALHAPPQTEITGGVRAWLGQPVEIKEPTAALLERYVRANLLIVGGQENQAHGLLLSTLLSIVAQRSPQDSRLLVVDFARGSSDHETPWNALDLPHALQIIQLNERGALTTDPLIEIIALLDERLAHYDQRATDVFFFVAGLHRWRELMPAEVYGQSDAGKQLLRLAEEGPEVGIHLIAWVDSYVTLERIFKRGSLATFDLRVLLRLSEFDSNQLIGTPHAARLEDNRALFRHEDWEMRRVEKFKPYVVPTKNVIQAWSANLHHKYTAVGSSEPVRDRRRA